MSRFARGSFRPESFRPGSFRPWVVSPIFGGSFRPCFFFSYLYLIVIMSLTGYIGTTEEGMYKCILGNNMFIGNKKVSTYENKSQLFLIPKMLTLS